jgi:pSer/pThr/pTyr-binding forkhead associated (FHA) protein
MYKNEKEIREYIEQIRELCDKVIESLDDDEDYDWDEDTENQSGKTEVFDELQKNAEESLGLKKLTTVLDESRFPYLIRKSTGEKIIVNRNIFKIGKEEEYVDYCISDNATISRSHADILRKTDGYYIKDMGSLNHTFLNGVKLEQKVPQKLKSGCLVQLANEVFEWHCDLPGVD